MNCLGGVPPQTRGLARPLGTLTAILLWAFVAVVTTVIDPITQLPLANAAPVPAQELVRGTLGASWRRREGRPGGGSGHSRAGLGSTKGWEPVIFQGELETDETQGGRVGVPDRKQLRQAWLTVCIRFLLRTSQWMVRRWDRMRV